MKQKIIFVFIFLLLITQLFFVKSAQAVSLELTAPTEPLQRGDEARITVNIDTQDKTLTSFPVGISFDTRYLEYVSTIPGDTFTTINASPLEAGKILINGLSDAGFTGSGVYAYINFRIVAQVAQWDTSVCGFFTVSPTPIPVTPRPTTPPPTAMPKTGNTQAATYAGLIGLVLILPAAGIYLSGKMNYISTKKVHHHKKNKS